MIIDIVLKNIIKLIVYFLPYQERLHKTRIQKLKTGHAEEVATLNLDIFELRDQLRNQNKGEQNIS